jgi:CRP/FNR family cyclic AMP-dependent transcriptional regulator
LQGKQGGNVAMHNAQHRGNALLRALEHMAQLGQSAVSPGPRADRVASGAACRRFTRANRHSRRREAQTSRRRRCGGAGERCRPRATRPPPAAFNRPRGHCIMSSELIAAITDPMVRELASRGAVRSFPKNTVIINEGDRGDSLFVILSGKVKVYVSDDDGREMILDHYGPGDYVGEMALDGRPRSASVMTLEPTSCSVVTRDALRAAIVANADVAMALIGTLIERARIATDNVKNLALMDVYGRVARLLLSIAKEQPDGKLVVPERMTQQDIADRVGASRDMISRIFKDLTIGGYVTVVDRIITINRKPPARW